MGSAIVKKDASIHRGEIDGLGLPERELNDSASDTRVHRVGCRDRRFALDGCTDGHCKCADFGPRAEGQRRQRQQSSL